MSACERKVRDILFTVDVNPYTLASAIVSFGNTKVHITASLLEKVPPFLKGKNKGWISAEYSMLPASTNTRTERERKSVSGRTMEIQRLIGRSLRSVVDLEKLYPLSLMIDCDCLVADGGTRTTSISGAYVVLERAIHKLQAMQLLEHNPLLARIAAISVGIVDGQIVSDLNYAEDSNCSTDMNVVMTHDFNIVEIQGTGEKNPFSLDQLGQLLQTAQQAIALVKEEQLKYL